MDTRNDQQTHWFVMRDARPLTSSELVYKRLMEEGIDVFTPLKWDFKTVRGRKIQVHTPIIHPLLFIRSTKENIRQMQLRHPKLQFIYQRGQTMADLGMTVRDSDMRHFRIALEMQKQPTYYQPGEITPDMIGAQIVIVNGPLKGFVGNLYRYKGRGHKVIVKLADFVSTTVLVAETDFRILRNSDDAQFIAEHPLLFTLLTDLTDLLDVIGRKQVYNLHDDELREHHSAYLSVLQLLDGGLHDSQLPTAHNIRARFRQLAEEMQRRALQAEAPKAAPLAGRVADLCSQIIQQTSH